MDKFNFVATIIKTILDYINTPWRLLAVILLAACGLIGYFLYDQKDQIAHLVFAKNEHTLATQHAQDIAHEILVQHHANNVVGVVVWQVDMIENRKNAIACDKTVDFAEYIENYCKWAFSIPIVHPNKEFLTSGYSIMEGTKAWSIVSMKKENAMVNLLAFHLPLPANRQQLRVGMIMVLVNQSDDSFNQTIIETSIEDYAERMLVK